MGGLTWEVQHDVGVGMEGGLYRRCLHNRVYEMDGLTQEEWQVQIFSFSYPPQSINQFVKNLLIQPVILNRYVVEV